MQKQKEIEKKRINKRLQEELIFCRFFFVYESKSFGKLILFNFDAKFD